MRSEMTFKYEVEDAKVRKCHLCKKPVVVLNIEGNDMTFDFKAASETGFIALRLHSFVCENWR